MKPSCSYCFPAFPMVFLWCSYVFLWFSYSFPMVSCLFLCFPMVSTLQGLDLGVGGGLGALRPLHAAADRWQRRDPCGAAGWGPWGAGTDRIAVGFKMCSDHWMYTLNIYIYAQIYKYIYIYII